MATSSNNTNRVSKRSSNACSRCRRQKIKCSGLQPCANCTKRNLRCEFDDRDMKILVTQGYLADLREKVERLERSHSIATNPPQLRNGDQPDEGDTQQPELDGEQHEQNQAGTRETSPKAEQGGREDAELTNPLLESPSKFMSSATGRSFYLGTSSNWSFHGQILSLVHEHTKRTPLPSSDLLFDGAAYDLPWDGTRSIPDACTPIIPSIDYAIFLINAVKFHCAQLVHLFDEEEFMSNLHSFYSRAEDKESKSSLWYVHFLLIIAFGKTFVQNKHNGAQPPGADFFVHALQLLPETNRLVREPIQAAEILCCKALYLQALDSRNAAYVTIGQAMRIALAQGIHTDMPIADLGEPLVERCRKVWWTIYILDRQMTSLMGLPLSIRDEDISCRLPTYPGSVQRAAALTMQIKLARIYAEIATNVYGAKGRLRKKFVVNIKKVLDDLTPLAEELRQSFPLHPDERFGGISRMPAHLHLLYYQTIVVLTRPLLFCCLKKVFESPREVEPLTTSLKIRHLLSMSLEASQKILSILESLQSQGLLETFLPWDLDSLFVSTLILIISRFIDTSLTPYPAQWVEKAFAFFDMMTSSGNRIAEFRIRELRKLEEMLSEYIVSGPYLQAQQAPSAMSQATAGYPHPHPGAPGNGNGAGLAFPADIHGPAAGGYMGHHRHQDSIAALTSLSDEGSGFGDDLTAEQIVSFAETMDIDIGGHDWLSFANLEGYHQMMGPQDLGIG
ncbi:Zn(II)2Cys6 transcription factor [Byssothecium circinans]|uniref:Zn(II)2Cys6 transcription factor n=1 Tax=Byssothecium circinans TaxID=147558 RepID=A0A6A5THG7_9PLEO|nr:Zn(II)2Cys6 transcription factor [Byssothecium circinans]